MEDHSHEIVTHLYHVKIPYHMTSQQIEFEATPFPKSADELLFEMSDYSDDEKRLIFKSVVLLLEKYPHRSLEDALQTAIVWLRG